MSKTNRGANGKGQGEEGGEGAGGKDRKGSVIVLEEEGEKT